MPRLVLPKYTVIRDTREKEGHGWVFTEHTYSKRRPPNCAGMITRTLETGDYSLEGYEDILSIERKENIAELWTNYSERERFEDEMERMSRIKHAYIIIETSLSSDHLDLSPPQYKTRAPGKSLIRWLTNITAKNNVKMMFAGECGKQVAQLIMEEVVRLEKDRWIVHGSDE